MKRPRARGHKSHKMEDIFMITKDMTIMANLNMRFTWLMILFVQWTWQNTLGRINSWYLKTFLWLILEIWSHQSMKNIVMNKEICPSHFILDFWRHPLSFWLFLLAFRLWYYISLLEDKCITKLRQVWKKLWVNTPWEILDKNNHNVPKQM